jgi:phage-related protein
MAALPLQTKQDSSKYGFEQEDVGVRSEMEGGYILTRPRHTRTPRRTWKTGWTDLSNAEKLTLEAFIASHGTYKAFDYNLPVEGTLVNVRFRKVPVYEYKGFGALLRWDINEVELEEV